MWQRVLLFLLLAASVFSAGAVVPARAGEFANEFDEYEYHAKPEPKKKSIKKDASSVYRVRKGDTLYAVARLYKVAPDALMDENNLSGGNLKAGMVLRIPGQNIKPARENRKKPAAGSPVPVNREASGAAGFSWPVSSVRRVIRDGEKGVKPIGILITGRNGATICSSAPGIVEKVGRMRGFGNFVVVRHHNRVITVYTDLEDVTVKEGDAVSGGGVIGQLASDSNTLHFMLHRAGKPDDPLKYLPKREG